MDTDSSSTELEAIARQALASFESRRSLFGLFQRRSVEYFDAVAALRAFVRKIDPNRFNDEQLSEVVAIIGRIVTFLEDYLATRVSHRDVRQRIFLADSIRDLRDARHWIAQRYSPDAAKRPSDDERKRLDAEQAAKSLN
ncbi:MAG TPA: hypothetical protein VFI71_14515 [Pyrinomonadaceae bacterium]|nr:hypothetical protein [Pyrinomonadaceae bacterium]